MVQNREVGGVNTVWKALGQHRCRELVDDSDLGEKPDDFGCGVVLAHALPILVSIGQRGLTGTSGPYPMRANI